MNRLIKIIRPGIPNFKWIINYQKQSLSGDLLAGTTVGIMLIPQCMAYATLAGLPPQIGLYASLFPMLFYITWGTSPFLSVAPVAISSIFIGSSVGAIVSAAGGTIELLTTLVATLALMEGSIQLIMGITRIGFIVNFISHPVLTGYISAAAISIILSQLGTMFGLSTAGSWQPFVALKGIISQLGNVNGFTTGISMASLFLLIYAKKYMRQDLKSLGLSKVFYGLLPKATPLLVVGMGILFAWKFNLDNRYGLSIVGQLPSGFPGFSIPSLNPNHILTLLPIAITLSLLSLLESYSVGKALAYKKAKLLGPNREFFALGTANIASSFSGGYSVSGSLSRSTVNFQSGANTKLSSLVTIVMVAITVTFFMPQLYYLPKAILAVIIISAVSSLIDFKYLMNLIKLNKTDALSFGITFISVFVFGVKYGLIIGIFASMVFYVWITSRPNIAVIGRIGTSEHFRNILRHEVTTHPHILTIRIDENLTFANSKFIEEHLNILIEEKKAMDNVANIEHFVFVTSNVNYIDISALETLEGLFQRLKNQGIAVILAEVKGPVMDFLEKSGFVKRFGKEKIFLSTHLALKSLTSKKSLNPIPY